jgi:hypothetical protein
LNFDLFLSSFLILFYQIIELTIEYLEYETVIVIKTNFAHLEHRPSLTFYIESKGTKSQYQNLNQSISYKIEIDIEYRSNMILTINEP